jgi:hypothetical protein
MTTSDACLSLADKAATLPGLRLSRNRQHPRRTAFGFTYKKYFIRSIVSTNVDDRVALLTCKPWVTVDQLNHTSGSAGAGCPSYTFSQHAAMQSKTTNATSFRNPGGSHTSAAAA